MKPQAELLQSQTSVENQDNSESNSKKIIERIPYPGSPLWIVGSQERGYLITFGKYKLTELQKSVQECEHILENEGYNIIFRMMGCILEIQKEEDLKNQTKKS